MFAEKCYEHLKIGKILKTMPKIENILAWIRTCISECGNSCPNQLGHEGILLSGLFFKNNKPTEMYEFQSAKSICTGLIAKIFPLWYMAYD